MRKNQKGFTLVELIIAVAILAIVTLAVCGFIVVGSRSYTSANTDIMLQQDAQLAFNQISDVIIDTTDSISYGVRSGGAGDMQLVLKDSEYAGEADEKCLIVVNKQEAGSLNDNKSYWFYWNKEKEIIYFNEVEASSDMSEADIRTAFESAADMSNVSILAQHVQEFSVDISQFEENRVVMLSAVFANGNREYITSNNVTVRNRIALNQVTIDPMTRATEFTINVVNNIILEPGDFFSLSTIVDVLTPSSDKELKWELVGGAQNGTSIVESSGDLRLGIGETRTNFSVKVSRANEEYAGQNDRVSKTIIVNVKRATAVNISGPSTAKQGETVNLTGAATGNQLGVGCTAAHPGDDISKDWALITSGADNWHIIEGSQYGSITGQTTGSAVLTINADATPGAKIRVQAASQLSATKGYGNISTPTVPPVTGTYEITIEKSTSSAIRADSLLKYGTDNETNPRTYDYLRAGLPSENGNYVCCVRVREVGDPNWRSLDDDYYYIYMTSPDMRFGPDIFGLDITKTYDVYMQALWPNVGTQTDLTEEQKDAIWKEYSENLDSNGKYVGNEYLAGEQYVLSLEPPAIQITCENKIYPYEDKSYQEKLYLSGDNKKNYLGEIKLYSDGTINVLANSILNDVRYTIYREDKEGNWDWLYGFDYGQWNGADGYSEKTQPKVGLEKVTQVTDTSSTYVGTSKLGPFDLDPEGNPSIIKRNDDGSQAVGKYHIVAGFVFANSEALRDGYYAAREIKKKIPGDFNTYFYKEWDCTVNVEITAGLTLGLSYEGQKNSEEYLSFPLPTDSDFPFGKEGNEPSKKEWQNYDIFTKSGVKTGNRLENVTVTCAYSSATGIYTIKFEKSVWGSKGEVIYDYGSYKWKAGDEEWTLDQSGIGAYEGSGSTWGPRITFTYNGQEYMMELPLSTKDSNWPFYYYWDPDGTVIEKEMTGPRMYYSTDDLLGYNGKQEIQFKMKWNEKTKVFELWVNNGSLLGKWTPSNDGKKWNVVNN